MFEGLGHVAKLLIERLGELYAITNVSAVIQAGMLGYKGKSPHELLTQLNNHPTESPLSYEELIAKKIAENAIIASKMQGNGGQ